MIAKSRLGLVAMLVFAAAAVPAHAQAQAAPGVSQEAPIVITRKLAPSPDLLVRTVFIGDLNLARADGQQVMEKRVSKAVDDMCAVPSPLPSYKGPMEKPCRDEAWQSARWQMSEAVQRATRPQ